MATEKLSSTHIALMISNTQAGVVVFTLPRLLSTHFGTNGWLAIIPMFLLASLNIYLISLVNRLGKGTSVFEILKTSIPNWILYPLYLGIGFVFAVIGSLVVKQYSLIYQMLIFPTTSDMIMKLVIDILVFILLTKGIYVISKANIIFVAILCLQMPMFYFTLEEFDWARLTPFFFKETENMAEGWINLYGAFMGYELSILLIPFANPKMKWMRAVQIGNLITAILYISIAVSSFGFFGYTMLKNQSFPYLDQIGYIKLPFVERLQNFLYSFFVLSIIQTAVMFLWSSCVTLKQVTTKLNFKFIGFIIIVTIYMLAFIPKSLIAVEQWFKYVTYTEIIIAFGLPILTIIVLLMQKRKVVG